MEHQCIGQILETVKMASESVSDGTVKVVATVSMFSVAASTVVGSTVAVVKTITWSVDDVI